MKGRGKLKKKKETEKKVENEKWETLEERERAREIKMTQVK